MLFRSPNFLTCLNLLCGSLANIFIFKWNVPVFSILIGCSLIFDFLDGFAARKLGASSPIGKELDSLADMVTFGLAPGMILCGLCFQSVPVSVSEPSLLNNIIGYFPLIVTIASALRLATFNVDNRQSGYFIGVPTPAITILVVGIALITLHDRFNVTPVILNAGFICGLSMIIAYLLNSNLRMIAFKFNTFSFKENQPQFFLMASSILSIVIFGVAGISLTVILYIVTSLRFQSGFNSNEPEKK